MIANLRIRVLTLESLVMTAEISEKVFGLIDSRSNQKRVVVLENQGAKVFKFPLPIIRSAGETTIKESLKKLKVFDWVVFSDIYTVEIFFEILGSCDIDPFELDELTVCAFGEAVADRLRFVQVHSDVIPAKLDDAAIIETLKSYTVGADKLSQIKVLFLSSNDLSTGFVKVLRSEVAEIIELKIYRAELGESKDRAKLIALLKGGAIDEFIFCSAEDVQNLLLIVYPEKLNTLLFETEVFATDSITFQSLSEHSLDPRLRRT